MIRLVQSKLYLKVSNLRKLRESREAQYSHLSATQNDLLPFTP